MFCESLLKNTDNETIFGILVFSSQVGWFADFIRARVFWLSSCVRFCQIYWQIKFVSLVTMRLRWAK